MFAFFLTVFNITVIGESNAESLINFLALYKFTHSLSEYTEAETLSKSYGLYTNGDFWISTKLSF